MKRVKRSIAKVIFPNIPVLLYLLELKKLLKNCESVLDVGCGSNSPLNFIKLKYVIGFDGYRPALRSAAKQKTHHALVYGNVTQLSKYFKPKSVDCCVALDVIEHLNKKQGEKLLRDMQKIARKKIIIFTPNGFLRQINKTNLLEEHRSGWSAEEMKRHGFYVLGMFGHKIFRGEMHRLKFQPKILWGVISELSNIFYTKSQPKHAASILCYKKL